MVCCCGNNNKADGDPSFDSIWHSPSGLFRKRPSPSCIFKDKQGRRPCNFDIITTATIYKSIAAFSFSWRNSWLSAFFYLAHALVSDIDLFIFILKLVERKLKLYWQSNFVVQRNVEKRSASDSRMNTVAAAAAEGCNELMMHSQLGAPSMYSRTRRWIAGEKKEEKSFSI